MILYAQTTGTHTTNSASWTAIPGLTFTLPEGVKDAVLVILNVPNPYASGTNFPGGTFGISVDGTVQAPTATFTYSMDTPQSFGRMPTTLVVAVQLTSKQQIVQGMWQNVRGSTVHIDSPSTLSGTF
ncbi:MAG TPA: hypothetical protein VGZ49_00025 [Xanthobacteraceae bacterium]|jgi:hypothetical protein|nr:hypothetical protein [Xanthobacteraceae bacterium]